jgi:atypical dual specificity phosphatase
MRKVSKRRVAPDYNRIPHFNKEISNMTHDDIELELNIEFPIECWIQEKADGANLGVSFVDDVPILRNKEHILKKGYSKIKTPAKKQFTSAWNWLHAHKEDIQLVSELWQSPITIYGEWLNYSHSIQYNKLPDLFLAYDIWSVEDNNYLAPNIVDNLLSQTSIKYIKPYKVEFNSIEEIIEKSEMISSYYDGISEGIVIKFSDGRFCNSMCKVVNKFFERCNDFNTRIPIKNKLLIYRP